MSYGLLVALHLLAAIAFAGTVFFEVVMFEGVRRHVPPEALRAVERAIGNRAVAVIGASPGGFGTILSQNAWLPVLKTLGTRHWSGGRIMLSRAHQAFDADGALSDENNRKLLSGFLQGFAKFV